MSENDTDPRFWYAVATKARDEVVAKTNLERRVTRFFCLLST